MYIILKQWKYHKIRETEKRYYVDWVYSFKSATKKVLDLNKEIKLKEIEKDLYH